jgi:hypothetical protein
MINTMRNPLIIFLFITLVCLSSCHGQQKDNSRSYYKQYVVGSIPSADNFSKLNEFEEEMDSMFKDRKETGLLQIRDFKNNRGRIFMTGYDNDIPHQGDSVISSICSCSIEKDTLYVDMSVGFFGGAGFPIKIFGKDFESSFFEYTDDAESYKTNPSDTASYGMISVKNKFQYLVIDKQPAFKPGQQLTGYLTFTSGNYYNKNGTHLDTLYVAGRLYFTCHTKPDIGIHRWGLN